MDKQQLAIELVDEVTTTIIKKLKETNSWESMSDDELMKLAMVVASSMYAITEVYNERHGINIDDYDTFPMLVDKKAFEMGL